MIKKPVPYDAIYESVLKQDKEFFQKHPRKSTYTRPMQDGELWPYVIPKGTRIKVTVLGPGVRARNTIGIGHLEPYPERDDLILTHVSGQIDFDE